MSLDDLRCVVIDDLGQQAMHGRPLLRGIVQQVAGDDPTSAAEVQVLLDLHLVAIAHDILDFTNVVGGERDR